MRHRLVVVGPTTAEVVRSCGGWLFDRALAGWETTVVTTARADVRPLRILGATLEDLESVLRSPGCAPRLEAIAVQAELCARDERVGRLLELAVADGVSEVRLWGEAGPSGPGPADATVRHRLSYAARAFKSYALAAASDQASRVEVVEAVETFRSSGRRSALVGAASDAR
jgi:hypothetical protein